MSVTATENIHGARIPVDRADFGNIDFGDSKVAFAVRGIEGKDVLDIGCVQHDPEAYRTRYWVHKALTAKARSVLGLDLSSEGVDYLRGKGFDIITADAQDFDLGRKFDVIFAGDIIEHLEDFAGFLTACKKHLNPGGELRITTPNPWYWRFVIKAILSSEVEVNPEHTCWFCPRTFRQLAHRHGLELSGVEFGSRYPRDRYMPLPRGLKHTTWFALLKPA